MKTKNQTGQSVDITKTMANKIAGYILTIQQSFANKLNKQTKAWPRRRKLVFLLGVCVLFGGMSLSGLFPSSNSLRFDQMFAPDKTKHTIENQPVNQLHITDSEFMHVQQFKQDHPDLQTQQPALFDSFSLVEEMYYSQKKYQP